MTIHAIVGGQYGSEAKGHVAAQLTRRLRRETNSNSNIHLVRVGGSNAGHSAVDDNGQTWALRVIPAAAVVDKNAALYLAQGSEIDCDVLFSEVVALDQAGFNVSGRLYIDPTATVIEQHHIDAETGSDINARVGSTQKGIGAARASRVMRTAAVAGQYAPLADMREKMFVGYAQTAFQLRCRHEEGAHVVIEGTQGYGLGLHTAFYPQTTSGDCRTVDVLAQIGYLPLNPRYSRDIYTWLVFRTYPIRVAGNSGHMANEIDWETLSVGSGGYIQPERTTVTKKIRRVAQWDSGLAVAAVNANGGAGDHVKICLMFADYLDPNISHIDDYDTLSDVISKYAQNWIDERERELGVNVEMLGTSPSTVVWRKDLRGSYAPGYQTPFVTKQRANAQKENAQ